MIVDVADCPECNRKGVGLVYPFRSGKEPPRPPKLAPHGRNQHRIKGKPNPRCVVGTGLEVKSDKIYKMSKRIK